MRMWLSWLESPSLAERTWVQTVVGKASIDLSIMPWHGLFGASRLNEHHKLDSLIYGACIIGPHEIASIRRLPRGEARGAPARRAGVRRLQRHARLRQRLLRRRRTRPAEGGRREGPAAGRRPARQAHRLARRAPLQDPRH